MLQGLGQLHVPTQLVLWPRGHLGPSPLHCPPMSDTHFAILTDDDDLGFEFANKDSELTEDEKIALLGKPKLGNATRTQIRIKENKEYRVSHDTHTPLSTQLRCKQLSFIYFITFTVME